MREPYNPIMLNAKTGYVLVNECTTCWAIVPNERTEQHANWHVKVKDEGTEDDGGSIEAESGREGREGRAEGKRPVSARGR